MIIDPIKAKELFLQALDRKEPSDRDRFLSDACGDNTELRREVNVLLSADAGAGSFLEQGAVATMDPPHERPGMLVGPYKLLEQIGEGGFGVVFMAEQTQPVRRKVALKVIKPGMDTRQVIARFEAERQALALMDHPNIARVLEAGATASGRPYFVMELVKGMAITEFCDQARLPTRSRLELFITVCHAVQHAHQKGIIHRDLKPNNVLVTLHDGTPTPKVIDFGIAKATGQQLTDKTLFTGFGQLICTPLYMSPEQAALSAVDVDTRSDVYSLGVLLYELLTGSTPLDKDTISRAAYDELRRMIREDDPPRPSNRISTLKASDLSTVSERRQIDPRRISEQVRGELDWIVMKSLEKDRNRRYESASGFAADVNRYLNDEAVQACPLSARYRFHKFARKNKAALTTFALVVGALLIGVVVSTWQAVRATRAEARARANEQLALAAATAERQAKQAEAFQRQAAEQSSNEARWQSAEAVAAREEAERQRGAVSRNLYYADMRLGLADWDAGNVGRLSGKLSSHVPPPGAEDRRAWEWYYLLGLCHQEERMLMHHRRAVVSVDWSADGRYLASTGQDSSAKVYDSSAGRLLWNWTREYSLGGRWSPDSNRLAWGTVTPDNGLYVGNAESGEVESFHGHTSSVFATAWSPDGTQLASGGMDGTIRIWDAATRSCIRVIPFTTGYVKGLAWHPDGNRLASAGERGRRFWIWDASSGQLLQEGPASGESDAPSCVAWSPDGEQLAVGALKGQCLVFQAKDWTLATECGGHTGPVNGVAWSSDGKQLASAGADGLVRVWDPSSGVCLRMLRGHLNQVRSVAWEPAGDRLVSGGMDGLVNVWPSPATFDSQPRRLLGHAGGVRAIAWRDDGNILRSIGAHDGTTALWDVVSKARLATATVPRGRTACLSAGGGQAAIASPTGTAPEVSIHDSDSGDLVQRVNGVLVPTKWSSFCAFSPDASKLAVTDGGDTLQIMQLGTDPVSVSWPANRCQALSWSPDGKFLATAGAAGSVDVGNVATHQRVMSVLHGADGVSVTALAWSPDGGSLVSGDVNGLAEVWQLPTGRQLATAPLHQAAIHALAWSPDGRRVASGSGDGTVRVWDPSSGEELLKLDAPMSYGGRLQWSPNGHRLAAAAADGSIYVWDASAGHRFAHSETYLFQQIRERLDRAAQLWDAGHKEQALSLFEQTLDDNQAQVGELPPWVGMSLQSHARAARDSGNHGDAVTFYTFLVRVDRSDAQTHVQLGFQLAATDRPAEAIACYREAIQLDPRNLEAQRLLAWMEQHQPQNEKQSSLKTEGD